MSTVASHSFRRLLIVVGLLSVVIAGRATSAEGRRETALPRTPDDQMADVGTLVPEFGGIYADSDRRAHLYLTDPSPAAEERARVALTEVFGADWPNGPGGEVLSDTNTTIHRADYGFAQLKRWHDRHDTGADRSDVWYSPTSTSVPTVCWSGWPTQRLRVPYGTSHPARDPAGRIAGSRSFPRRSGLVGDAARQLTLQRSAGSRSRTARASSAPWDSTPGGRVSPGS